MHIDSKLKLLRVRVRQESKAIIDFIIKTQVSRNPENIESKEEKEICIFCNATENLTKEHVIPKWVFENCAEKTFITDVNEIKQTYNKTTVFACSKCNNDWLSYVEKYIAELFSDIKSTEISFSDYEIQNIVRWLEIIEYKFQIFEISRKYLKHKKGPFIKYLADFPISMMRGDDSFSPSKVVSQIRFSQKRITIKSKEKNINSLVVFRTKNESFYFFHNMDEFIFLELPSYKIALFYFYNKTFENSHIAYDEAMEIIKRVYAS